MHKKEKHTGRGFNEYTQKLPEIDESKFLDFLIFLVLIKSQLDNVIRF